LLVIAMLPLALFARPVPPGVDAAQVEIAARQILCDCGCHPQSVHDCACGRAEDMWAELATEVASGGPDGGPLTGEQVVAKWVAARGEIILVAPEATGFNLVAWLGPFVLLLGAAVTLTLVLRRWSAATVTDSSGSDPAAAANVDPSYRERIRRDVEELR
jgi:cytochrome c-type biogenesis protein CcmH